jgi:hypothetical protein
MLVLVPAALRTQWQSMLHQLGVASTVLDSRSYRVLQNDARPGVSPFGSAVYVCSYDFFKDRERISEVLELNWAAVILDEAQQCSAGTQRAHVAELLWRSPNIERALALNDSRAALPWTSQVKETRTVVWKLRDLISDWPSLHVPARTVEFVPVELSREERRVIRELKRAVKKLEGQSAPAEWFGQLLLRRASSSIFALEQSLLLRQAKESLLLDDLGLGESDTDGELQQEAPSTWDVETTRRLLDLVQSVAIDSKWVAVSALVRRLRPTPNRQVIVFSEFRDTAEYLALLWRDQYRTTLVTSDASISYTETLGVSSNASSVLVATYAFAGTLDPGGDRVIHYDLPQSAEKFARLLISTQRFGQTKSTKHYIVHEDTKSAHKRASTLFSKAEYILAQ